MNAPSVFLSVLPHFHPPVGVISLMFDHISIEFVASVLRVEYSNQITDIRRVEHHSAE